MRPSEHRLGVLFEISIVCHVFVFVVLADGWGFVFWLVRRVFSGSGFFWFLASSCFLRFGRGGLGVGLSGVFSGSGLGAPGSCSLWGWGSGASGAPGSCVFVRGLGACAPGSCSPVFWGVGVGCVCASGSFLGCGFRGWVGRPGSFLGVGCAWFPVRVRGGFCRVRGGFPGFFVSARRFLPLVWGVSGWVGVVFSPAVIAWPGLVLALPWLWGWCWFGFGFVWRV